MRRREFISFLGSTVAWPFAAQAQQPMMPIVGLLSPRSPEDSSRLGAAFRKALNEAGYIEGQNVTTGLRANSIACPRSWPTWSAVAWP